MGSEEAPREDWLSELPHELFVKCVQFLRWDDLLVVLNVCREWRRRFLNSKYDSGWECALESAGACRRASELTDDSKRVERAPLGVQYIRFRAELCHGCNRRTAISGLFAVIGIISSTLLPICEACFDQQTHAVITEDRILRCYGVPVLRQLDTLKDRHTLKKQRTILGQIDPNAKSVSGVCATKCDESPLMYMEANGTMTLYPYQKVYSRNSVRLVLTEQGDPQSVLPKHISEEADHEILQISEAA